MKRLSRVVEEMNILISKLCNFSAAGSFLLFKSAKRQRGTRDLFRSLRIVSCSVWCAKNCFRMDHKAGRLPFIPFCLIRIYGRRKEEGKIVLIVFLYIRVYLGSFFGDVEVIIGLFLIYITCRRRELCP